GDGGAASLMRQISSRRPVFQKASWNFVEREVALDRYSALDPITNHEAADIRISNPSTPLTTGDAFRMSEMMSSRASPAPACRMSGNIGRDLLGGVRAAPRRRGCRPQFDTIGAHS